MQKMHRLECNTLEENENSMKTTVVVLAVFVCSAVIVSASPIQWQISAGGNGHWYEVIVVTNGIMWTQARDAAVASNGYLATITSFEENQFVYDLASQNDSCWSVYNTWINGPWMGGYKDNGFWCWVTGEAWDYTNWAPCMPDNQSGIEDCLAYGGIRNALRTDKWNDAYGDNGECTFCSYITEFDSVPEPASIIALLCGLGGLVFRKRSRHF